MPLYFFDSSDGRTLANGDPPLEFPNDQVARKEALKALGELAEQYVPNLGHQERLDMTVRDENRLAILHLSLTLSMIRPQ